VHGVVPPQVQDPAFALLNLVRFLSSQLKPSIDHQINISPGPPIGISHLARYESSKPTARQRDAEKWLFRNVREKITFDTSTKCSPKLPAYLR